MSTPKAQRVGIWIIAIALTIGTLGSFLVIVLSNENQKIDQAQQTKQEQEYQKEYLAQQKAAAEKNADNSEGFGDYGPRKFNASDVQELKVETLKSGDGRAVKPTDTINVSYFGWTPDGKVFDSTKKKDSDTDQPATLPLDRVIQGWTEGLTGVKVGSVVRVTIPANKAYGAQGSGAISPNEPLEFIVKVHKIEDSATSE